MKDRRTWICFLLITACYWLNYASYEGMKLLVTLPSPWASIIVYALLILVAFIGWFGLLLQPKHWVVIIWKLLYAVGIVLVFTTGGILFLTHSRNPNILDLTNGLRMFLTSPVVFAVLVFFASRKFKVSAE